MQTNQPGKDHANAGAKARSRPALLIDMLAAVKFAVSVVVLIAIACFVGTILPQGTEVAAYVQRHPEAASRMEWFGRLGLTHVFHSWWFIALLCVLASTVATCSARRFATVRRTTGFAQRRAFGSMISHISILLILAGGVIRAVWGEKGFIELRQGQTIGQFQVENGSQPLPFAVQLARFEIETDEAGKEPDTGSGNQLLVEWPARNLKAQFPVQVGVERVLAAPGETPTAGNSYRVKIVRYVPDFIVDMATRQITSRSDAPNNPAILVEVTGANSKESRWLFARFPDFGKHAGDGQSKDEDPLQMAYQASGAMPVRSPMDGPIKNFKSTLNIVENAAVSKETTVEVNRPFKYKGYTFYQSGYNPNDPTWTSLQVVRDPGVPVVYAGFLLMILGLFIVFYLNPWMEQKKCPRAQGPKFPSAKKLPLSGTTALNHSGTPALAHPGDPALRHSGT